MHARVLPECLGGSPRSSRLGWVPFRQVMGTAIIGVQDTFSVSYTPSGVKDLLRRIGVSYHKVSGLLWKADPDKQRAFVKRVARHKREAMRPGAPLTRRYYVDACHPVWGLDLVFSCWLLVAGQSQVFVNRRTPEVPPVGR